MLAATLRCGNSRSSWKIMPDPATAQRRSIPCARVEEGRRPEPDLSGVGPGQPGDQPQQGRLARPRRPEDDADLAAEPQGDVERQAGDGPGGPGGRPGLGGRLAHRAGLRDGKVRWTTSSAAIETSEITERQPAGAGRVVDLDTAS